MSDNNNKSEIARIKAQIAAEHESAKRAMNGTAIVAQHEFITARMERMGMLYDQLKGIVGEAEAVKALKEAMEGTKDDNKNQ